jgi:ADP-heptose:LPS heptosyltransferase
VPRIAASSVDFPGSLLDVRHRIADDVHEVQRALDLARATGYPLPDGDDGALRIERGGATARPFPQPTRYVVVHPGASVSARAWAPRRHAELVAALAARGRHVVVTGAPGERELTARVAAAGATAATAAPAATAAAGAPAPPATVRDLGGQTDLAGLADVIAEADAIVVGNTGPAHLAAAVGTPVVSLYAPTVPLVRWRPWQVPHELLYRDVPCAGCRARRCPVPGHPCIDDLPLETVLGALERLAAPAPATEHAAVVG